MEEILNNGAKTGRPSRPANLGYFVSSDKRRENAENVWVLVVHYNFENAKDKDLTRHGDAKDVENLAKTFKTNRNCNFRSLLSPEKGLLLQLLADQEKLSRFFACTDVLSVLMLYILSHGDREGVIYTDHYQNAHSQEFITFNTMDIFGSLKNLKDFENCLKIVNFGPCRGEQSDDVVVPKRKSEVSYNENSCRITYAPKMRNLVTFYSTVETTKAKRDEFGTAFVYLTCRVLNSMVKDESLINVFATIQHESHKNVDFADGKQVGQTPEVKMFSQDRHFFVSKSFCSSTYSNCSTSDAMGSRSKRLSFYPWQSSSGEKLRHRIAFLLAAEQSEHSKELQKALSQNLDFETCERKLCGKTLLNINEVTKLEMDTGCIFIFLFGRLSEHKETHEVCIQVENRQVTASEILLSFIGPKNEQWIGKPKIFFLIHQATSATDYITPKQSFEISATNHSGWFVLVLHSKENVEKLIEIFKGQELKRHRSLQELLADLLISESKEELLNSTLHYLVDFPDTPRSFVEPSFSVQIPNMYHDREEVQLSTLMKDTLEEPRVWLLRSVAGAGKTTVLREMAFQIGKQNPEVKVLRVALSKVSFTKEVKRLNESQFLAVATNFSLEEINELVKSKKCVVFLDGFDEIIPANQQKVLKLIGTLRMNQIAVWIGTRPHDAEVIQTVAPAAFVVEVLPSIKEQQIELVELETGKSSSECETFLDNFPTKDILANPMHLSLVAQCGAKGNLYQIYEQVLRYKVELFLIRKGYDATNNTKFEEEVETAMELLRRIAFRCITRIDLDGPVDKKEDLEKINGCGVATYENDAILFSHQTFAEFLAAQHFINEIEEAPEVLLSGEGSKLFLGRSFDQCRKFVDLYYSTVLNDREKLELHKEAIKGFVHLNPGLFLETIACNGLKNIFNMISPLISFSQDDNLTTFTRDKILLVKAVKGAEEIAIRLLEMGLIRDDGELIVILPLLLKQVAQSNASLFLEKLEQKFPRLPGMIRSRRFVVDAGIEAARNRHAKTLDFLLESGVDVDHWSEFRGNALYQAIHIGDVPCVKVLMKHGAKMANGLRYDYSVDPLIEAVHCGNLELVEFFLEESISGFHRNEITFETKEFLADLNAFQFAVQMEKTEIAKFLFRRSPILINTEIRKESPLQYSVGRNFLHMGRWIVDEAGVDLDSLVPKGDPRDWSRDDVKNMDFFLMLQSDVNRVDQRGKTALHCAAEYGFVDCVRKLIDGGVNVQAKDKNGWNAFHFACKSRPDILEDVVLLLHSTDGQLAKEKTAEKGQTGLHILIEHNYGHYSRRIRFLVEDIGVDVKARDNSGRTALRVAIDKRSECVSYLMEKDVDPAIKDRWGRTCLHVAAMRGNVVALQEWIALGGGLDVEDGTGQTALHYAAAGGHLQFVQNLLLLHCSAGLQTAERTVKTEFCGNVVITTKVNEFDRVRSVLHHAVGSRNVDLVQTLLDCGADLTARDTRGFNALHYALNSLKMVRFIHEKNPELVKHRVKKGDTFLHSAIYSNTDDEIIRWLVESGLDLNATNDMGDTPLLAACIHRKWSVVEMLLAKEVDVNIAYPMGKTALHHVAENGHLDLVRKMVEKGADTSSTNNEGKNALHCAVSFLPIMEFLHEKNCNLVKQRLINGNTTLHQAAVGSFNWKEVIPWLVEQIEIDLNATNDEGETPLMLACKNGRWEIAKFLLSKNADIHAEAAETGHTALHYASHVSKNRDLFEDKNHHIAELYAFDVVQELLDRGADLASTDNEGKHSMHHAVTNLEMILFLHEKNADLIKKRLKNGDTMLHLAVRSYDGHTVMLGVIRWLLEQRDVDLNAKNREGETPLLLACKFGKLPIAKMLLDKKADVSIEDNEAKSALHYAEEMGQTIIAKMIIDLGKANKI